MQNVFQKRYPDAELSPNPGGGVLVTMPFVMPAEPDSQPT